MTYLQSLGTLQCYWLETERSNKRSFESSEIIPEENPEESKTDRLVEWVLDVIGK